VDSPCLYQLTVRDADGATAALERFGVRGFETRGDGFYLNGKPFYFLGMNTGGSILGGMHTWSHSSANTTKHGYNVNNCARILLHTRKEAGMNSMRVHTGPNIKLAYDLCDEVGFVVRDEWSPFNLTALPEGSPEGKLEYRATQNVAAYFTHDESDLLPAVKAKLKQWVEWNNNNPSVCTRSGGNEHSASNPMTRLYVKLFYRYVHEYDRQNRPVTQASGLHWGGKGPLAWKALPCDYIDYHTYIMSLTTWLNGASFNRWVYEKIKAMYPPHVEMPFINGECMWVATKDPWKTLAPEDTFDDTGEPLVEGYLKFHGDIFSTRQHKNLSIVPQDNLKRYGIRALRSQEARALACGEDYKRGVEIFRRDCPFMSGYSLQLFNPLNERTFCIQGGNANEFNAPETRLLGMAQQPLLAIPDFWRRHVFAGREWAFNVHVVNNRRTGALGNAVLVVELRDAKRTVESETLTIGSLAMGERTVFPVSLDVPGTAGSGDYDLVTRIEEDGATKSRNRHDVSITTASDLPPIVAVKKVALYAGAGAHTTEALLQRFDVAHTRVDDMDGLDQCHVLIIGMNSLDGKVSAGAKKIRRWIEKGGRALVFEQEQSIEVPWAPALRYASAGPFPFSDMVASSHPVFRTFRPHHFEAWGDDNIVYDTYLLPIGPNLLAAGSRQKFNLYGRNHKKDREYTVFGMTMAEFRLGKGACLLSQLKVTENFEKDSAACRFAHNLLSYAVASEWPVEGIPLLEGDTGAASSAGILDAADVTMFDLSAHANKPLEDDGENHGWMDIGADISGIKRGMQYFGGVPFNLRPEGTEAAIVLGDTPKMPKPELPTSAVGVGVGVQCKALHFLHTAAYVVDSREAGHELAEYVMTYSDGSRAAFSVKNLIDLADWHGPKAHKNAKLVWVSLRGKGVYLSTWQNPDPDKRVVSIDIVSKRKALLGILAVTAEKCSP